MIQDFIDAIVAVDDAEECESFLHDVFTATEIEQFAQRLRAAKLLIEGQTYAQIIAKTDISSATLSRVSNCVRRGSGGYKSVLDKLQKRD
ncbi:MAG: TrpR-related protein YerC/YecD [Clostridia bacterium]|nr:TrpR-related protein YerC/YecD [Clostridia bacterium]